MNNHLSDKSNQRSSEADGDRSTDRRGFFTGTVRTVLIATVGTVAAVLGLRARSIGACRTTSDCHECLVRKLCSAELRLKSEEESS